MSTIAERFRAEAEQAEAETPEPEPEPEPDEEEEAEEAEPAQAPPSPPMSEKELEAMAKKMDAESVRHEKRVHELLGADREAWHECPLCPIPGYVPTTPPPEFDPAQRMAVLEAMGDVSTPTLKSYDQWYRCATCDGWGDLATGSRRQGADTKGCPDCNGYGYRDKAVEAATASVVQFRPEPAPQPPAWADPNGPEDAWHRPAGHPHFGIDPRYAGV